MIFVISKDDIIEFNGSNYVVCRRICEQIGLSRGQLSNERKKIKNDYLLKRHYVELKISTKGGFQNTLCLNTKCLGIWLTKINLKTLSDNQYKTIVDLLNYSVSAEFENYKFETKIYGFESELRDELYNIGYFNDMKIIDKEVSYDFGRIDLLCTNDNNENICVELKKYKEFDDTKEQLLRYKNSNVFDKVIYCAYEIENEFKIWCKSNNIITYTYSRQLNISECEVCV